MATHLSLRTDAFDGPGVFDRHQKVLVPGPNWPNDPRDVQLSTITYPDPDAVRDVVQALKDLQAATTLSPAKTDEDVIYRTVVYRDVGGNDTIFACNPDDPANPDTITLDAAATALTEWYQDDVLVASSTKANVIGTDLEVTWDAVNEWVEIAYVGAGGGGGAVDFAFRTIVVSGEDSVVADAAEDTLELITGANIDITTDAANDTITFSVVDVTTAAFTTIAVQDQPDVVADSPADTLTLIAGDFIDIETDAGSDSIVISCTLSPLGYEAGLYLDLTGSTFHVDLTEVSNWNPATDDSQNNYQFLMQNEGVIQWMDGMAVGMVLDNVAAATMDGTTFEATPGITADCVQLLTWDAAMTGLVAMIDESGDPLILKCVNLDKTQFRASTAEPGLTFGRIYGDISTAAAAATALFVLPTRDMRNLPGFDPDVTKLPGMLDSDSSSAKLDTLENWLKELGGWTAGNLQSIGHDDSTYPAWQDDDDECPA